MHNFDSEEFLSIALMEKFIESNLSCSSFLLCFILLVRRKENGKVWSITRKDHFTYMPKLKVSKCYFVWQNSLEL